LVAVGKSSRKHRVGVPARKRGRCQRHHKRLMGCTISSTLFLGAESSVVVPKPLISSRNRRRILAIFRDPPRAAPIFPVPGYADGAGPSSPLASSNRRAGVAPAWAPRDATNLSRGVGAPVRVRAAGPRHAGIQLLMDQTKRDGDRREVISCVSAGGSPSFGGHMREAT